MKRNKRYSRALLAWAVCLLAACASRPPVEQYLDMKTGATISRVARPLILDHSEPRFTGRLDEWVLLAPVEINRAGDYRFYLWVELPTTHEALTLSLDVDGQPMDLALATENRRSIAVGDDVYADQSAFGFVGYYHLSEAQLLSLANSQRVALEVADIEGSFATEEPQPEVLATFRQLAELN